MDTSSARASGVRECVVDAMPPVRTGAASCSAWTRVVLASCVVLMSGCASQRLAHHPWCRELATFANSVGVDEARSVTFETVWGSTKVTPYMAFGNLCLHHDYAPGKRFCDYLIRNTSTEFADINFRQTPACLSGSPLRTKNIVRYRRLEAEAYASGGLGIPDDIRVELSLAHNPDHDSFELTISATRYAD